MTIEKCSPVEMRKNLNVVDRFREYGIDFIAVPVRDHAHKKELAYISMEVLAELEEECDK